MLSTAFAKSLRNLFLPGVVKIFLWCLLCYALAFTALSWGISWLIDRYIDIASLPGFISGLIAGAGGFFLAWILFPLLYPLLISFFDEEVVAIIDDADYPQRPRATAPFWPTLTGDIIFTGKALALNIICLPFFFIPLVGVAVYYVLNGYLLGTQFYRMAAGRRITPEHAATLQKKNFTSILTTGVTISFLATVPVLNLAAPILGVAIMLHLFYLHLEKSPA